MYLHQRNNWWEFRYLVEKGVMRKNNEGGRSTNYSLVTE